MSEPTVDVWRYDATTSVLRQSIRTHFEAPFMYLLVGKARAMLVDTGTGDAAIRDAVDAVLAKLDVELIVAHTHGHDDHVGGDDQFDGRRRTSVVGHSFEDVTRAFGIGPSARGAIDLGERVVDVIPIPGHEPSHVAFYDRATRLLLTGDVLYPGRLFVRNWLAYRSSVERLVEFVDAGHPVTHILGSHVELSVDGVEYDTTASEHPNERPLALGENDLRDLLATLHELGDRPTRAKRPGYVIVPLCSASASHDAPNVANQRAAS